jgi:hypothetical protein
MADIGDEKLKDLEKLLNGIITNGLYNPPGDPDWPQLAASAAAYKSLQLLGLKIEGEEDVRLMLREENICEENFLHTFKIE